MTKDNGDSVTPARSALPEQIYIAFFDEEWGGHCYDGWEWAEDPFPDDVEDIATQSAEYTRTDTIECDYISRAEHEAAVKLVLDAGLSTGHADGPEDLMAEVLSQIEDLYILRAELREYCKKEMRLCDESAMHANSDKYIELMQRAKIFQEIVSKWCRWPEPSEGE